MRTRQCQISQSLLDEYLVYKVHNNQGDIETRSRSLFPSHLVNPTFEPQDWLFKTEDNKQAQQQFDNIMGPVLNSTPTEYWLVKDSQRSAVTERVPDHPALSQWLYNPNQPEPTKATESTKITESEPSLMWLAAAATPKETIDNRHQEWLSKSSDNNNLWLSSTKSRPSQNNLLLSSCWLASNHGQVNNNNQWMSSCSKNLDNSQWLITQGSGSPLEGATTLTQSVDMWLSDAMSCVDIHQEDEVDSGLSEGAGSSIVVIEPEEEQDEDFEDFQEDEDMSRWLAI